MPIVWSSRMIGRLMIMLVLMASLSVLFPAEPVLARVISFEYYDGYNCTSQMFTSTMDTGFWDSPMTSGNSWVGDYFNDRLSSVKLPPSSSVTIWTDINYSGSGLLLSNSGSGYSCQNIHSQWDNKMSSYQNRNRP